MGNRLFDNAVSFAKHLARLHDQRRRNVRDKKRAPRIRLSTEERAKVLKSTGRRCHICGGEIAKGARWTADHVLPHAQGGGSGVENHLPAHGLCNNYRWHYTPEEMQWILKLGVWARSRIEEEDQLGMEIASRFVAYEHRRAARRKGAVSGP